MDILIIKHSDINEMNMDEMRELKARWDKMNKIAITVCNLYLAPFAFVTLSSTMRFVMQLLGLAIEFNTMIRNILPLVLTVTLLLALVQMKYDNIKGHIVTFLLYLSLLLISTFSTGFSMWLLLTIPLSLLPVILTLRCIVNYNIIIELREMPGYPMFYYTVSSKFADEIYLKEEKKPQQVTEDYKPWNAFDEETVKNKEDKGENSDDEDCIKEEGNDF
ncbi:MAG: hypothetical protein GX848_07470 [Clostridiales bacterium]|nr:hypothetical protein [Clostridiales bacterium]